MTKSAVVERATRFIISGMSQGFYWPIYSGLLEEREEEFQGFFTGASEEEKGIARRAIRKVEEKYVSPGDAGLIIMADDDEIQETVAGVIATDFIDPLSSAGGLNIPDDIPPTK